MRTFDPLKYALVLVVFLSSFLWAPFIRAQGEPGTYPVAREDLKVFLTLARQEKCRSTTPPVFNVTPLHIIKDYEGRTYGTVPFGVTLDWCNYKVEGRGTVAYHEYVAPPKPPGLYQPRLKLLAGFSLSSTWKEGLKEGAGVGVAGHLLVWRGFYPFLHGGTEGGGAGLGYYLTPTVGVNLAYTYTWEGKHEPFLGVSFGLW